MLQSTGRSSIVLKDHISEFGIDAIIDKVHAETSLYLPTNFDMRWRNSEGKLTTRIRKWLFQSANIRASDNFITELGNIVAPHYTEHKTIWYDITDKIDWQAGDFGDDNSCFWQSRAGGKQMLIKNGGMAIRLWEQHESRPGARYSYGYARAWLVNMDDDHVVIFNAYGERLETFAIVISEILRYPYSYLELRNNGFSSGNLWINNKKGIVIGPNCNTISTYDMRWPEIDVPCCSECDTALEDEDEIIEHLWHIYCPECFHRYFIVCEHCGEACSRDDAYYVSNDEYICQECYYEEEDEEDEEESLLVPA